MKPLDSKRPNFHFRSIAPLHYKPDNGLFAQLGFS
jgi:hypothetical protein